MRGVRNEKRGSASGSGGDSSDEKGAGVGARKKASGGASLAKTESREDVTRGRGVDFTD